MEETINDSIEMLVNERFNGNKAAFAAPIPESKLKPPLAELGHDVAFGMNHSSGHTVTRGYVKVDFKRAWLLNEKYE